MKKVLVFFCYIFFYIEFSDFSLLVVKLNKYEG